MAWNTIGKLFCITSAGESRRTKDKQSNRVRGDYLACVVDGCPSGLILSEDDIQPELDRRKPGQSIVTTSRKEEDIVAIHSGVFEGKTTGAPILITIENKVVSEDVLNDEEYDIYKRYPRPGHADFVYGQKYGDNWNSIHGGRASGRVTTTIVAGGAVAKKILRIHGIEILAHTIQIYKTKTENNIKVTSENIKEFQRIIETNKVRCLDEQKAKEMEEEIVKAKKEKDSVGGVIEVVATGVPSGLGEPIFDKLHANLAKALMSIPAIKAVEIGEGHKFSSMRGSEALDEYILSDGKVRTLMNKSGGVEGGISNGMPIIARVWAKPISSLPREIKTVDLKLMEEVKKQVVPNESWHDPCIVPRVIPVVEAMMAITLLDHALMAGFIPRVLK